MATTQGKDIICCQLCSNPVKHHCNLCHVDLCPSCIAKHMADQSREHEVVGYTSRKIDTFVLPTCSTHEKKQCEAYCQDCKIPICIKCLIDSHKRHKVIEINNFLQKQTQQIKADIQKLENVIVSKCRDVISSTTTADFDKILHAIEEQENKICEAVYEMSIHLKDNVTKQKEEAVKKCKESDSLRKKAKKEIDYIIQHNKDILRCKDTTAIIKYQSSSYLDFQDQYLPRAPGLLQGSIRREQIAEIFGYLHPEDTMFETD
ncbi:E3 ubiquitin-protein ligase TRIM45-like [Saccostrea cucullata]|uniref:E3 ubiquitin-protein ligase TRIM45-like n=1 Tax=Saccostrea cuccullata TaxID=36930 RepID=UPI002ED1192D